MVFSCRTNDPNGPFYDPVHKLYHNFYQIHVAEDQKGAGDGPDWGHWVSKDFVRWAQLPVAIWNDRYYDNSAIFTGSTTIVDGKPVIMYPGKCKGACNEGKGGFTYVLVVPKNESDPLYVEWTKEGSVGGKPFRNPVVNTTGDDPSTAWRTKHGEWRLIGNQVLLAHMPRTCFAHPISSPRFVAIRHARPRAATRSMGRWTS